MVMATPISEGMAFYRPGFLVDHESIFKRLVTEVTWDDRIRARRVASFGSPYNYSGVVWAEAPMPSVLSQISEMVATAVGYVPNNCLANFYPDGSSTMGYHSDSVDELEPDTGIAIVSLGAARVLSFRRKSNRSEIDELMLESGSLFYMSAAMQSIWRHAVLRSEGVISGRISLTFRRIK